MWAMFYRDKDFEKMLIDCYQRKTEYMPFEIVLEWNLRMIYIPKEVKPNPPKALSSLDWKRTLSELIPFYLYPC